MSSTTKMTIYKTFTFDSAHRLTKVPPDHKCYALHGHTYQLTVYVSGTPDKRGFCGGADYSEIKTATEKILLHLDHRYLNDVDVRLLHNPTTESLVAWIWPRLKVELPNVSKIELKESSTTGCIYEGQ